MAEQHDADREPQPIDEEAAWAAIVAGYGEEPADPPGAKPFKSVEDLARLEGGVNDAPRSSKSPKPPESEPESTAKSEQDSGPGSESEPEEDRPALGSSITFAPGVGGAGPRDYRMAEPKDEDLDESDEGHFVPPEPPPLPEADVTAKFAWLAVIGGPVLMLLAVLFRWDMTWWLTTLCVGGFLGGFVTLVARMSTGDDEDDDPGRGAVV
ncbi:hypothetical protein [Streptomyces katsurahamanus]|uniref:DUF308 domain-containing protein n=1 Tax=Streptomyces katsurahamanus TaxID=2577098 RepID=A0ABW9NPL5_9ACTN|nr:hypothetical protein [Streptomyces katsurahamanus]MQS35221.1 hypothetical protein [Streptomyces katsurahamanus]